MTSATQSLNTLQKRELDELRIKTRILESRRAEDQERMRDLEVRAEEAETLKAARGKLQGTFPRTKIANKG